VYFTGVVYLENIKNTTSKGNRNTKLFNSALYYHKKGLLEQNKERLQGIFLKRGLSEQEIDRTIMSAMRY
jgi:hypothetical protein